MITRDQAIQSMVTNYPLARAQVLANNPGLFGKTLDNKARKQALRMAGIELQEGMTIAWATPDDWAKNGYRGNLGDK